MHIVQSVDLRLCAWLKFCELVEMLRLGRRGLVMSARKH